jgi:tetratricopeptide (TPR) repeat protein
MTIGEMDAANRQRRQLAEQAIGLATRGDWEGAVQANQGLLDLGPDTDAYNRLGKALAELGRHAEALDAYQQALARDATNRIAERNVERLRVLAGTQAAARAAAASDGKAEKAKAAVFIEEMGKTGHARLFNIAGRDELAPLSPGDQVMLRPDGDHLLAYVGDIEIGQVEPRVGSRLVKLIAGGNRYDAAITILSREDVRIIIRETFSHAANFGKVSFPGSSTRGSDVRPYLKGSALRYDDEEESEELDEDQEEVEELDTSLPEYSAEPELEEELLEEP